MRGGKSSFVHYCVPGQKCFSIHEEDTFQGFQRGILASEEQWEAVSTHFHPRGGGCAVYRGMEGGREGERKTQAHISKTPARAPCTVIPHRSPNSFSQLLGTACPCCSVWEGGCGGACRGRGVFGPRTDPPQPPEAAPSWSKAAGALLDESVSPGTGKSKV